LDAPDDAVHFDLEENESEEGENEEILWEGFEDF
jgi:hypothetical protein